ncbi:MAG TPA: GTPase Era [Arcobacter sp.]|nr:GTPase Era [Arcobacter sp.]HIP56109.1 GTPase Era [Arcobacter sp.]
MNKCGYVSAIGRPNAGKSSLLNWLVGEKINMVSAKANATRKRSNTIVMHEEDQIIFVDTPGLHKQEKLINQFMLKEALRAIGDCDLVLFLAPVTDKVIHYEKFLEENKKNKKHILLLTKTDFITADEVAQKIKEYEKYNDKYLSIMPISIQKGTKQSDILSEVVKYLPESPYLYDTEIMTTTHLREIYKEFIRESVFDNISDEIPYEADVVIEKVEEKPRVEVIKATIVVEKSTQKGMIIGKGGEAIKRIGLNARKKIEPLIGKKVYLELFVSVKKGWSKNKASLKEMGYDFE